jgi:hypothetical protein
MFCGFDPFVVNAQEIVYTVFISVAHPDPNSDLHGLHNFVTPDPDPHQSGKAGSGIWILIKGRSRTRIRIRIIATLLPAFLLSFAGNSGGL